MLIVLKEIKKNQTYWWNDQNWICSISTISTPHDGITLGDHLNKNFSFIQYFIGLAGVIGTDFYNFDLEQWGFKKRMNLGGSM